MSKISVKLIDNEKKRVVFAETGSDFIDVLFSFLTLLLGSIVRLLGKQSSLGSLDRLYESVEQLDVMQLQTEAFKEMLLKPRSAVAMMCYDLQIKKYDDQDPRCFYTCGQDDCLVKSTCYYMKGAKGICGHCGKLMNCYGSSTKRIGEMRRIFLSDIAAFIITDDLQQV